MSNRIKTTGQLREYLVSVLEGVESGKIQPDKARTIAKVAAQINESFYAEIKVGLAMIALGSHPEITKIGDLEVSHPDKPLRLS